MTPDTAAASADTGSHPRVHARHPASTIVFGAKTHPGKVRANNEDQFLVARLAKSMEVCKSSLPDSGACLFSQEEGHIFVVADGMGGAAAGEQASALAIASVEEFVLNTFKWFLHLGGAEEHELFTELRQGLKEADRVVFDRARTDPKLYGMGTTLTMAYSLGRDLFLVHAGDTRAYLFHDGELQRLTSDHTLVQLLVDNGAIRPEEAKTHKRRNVVTNVLGGPSEGVHAEIKKLQVADGDVLLLCSDGLTEPVTDDDIAHSLAGSGPPEAACDDLIRRALERGGPDNVTVVVVHFRFDAE